VVKETDWKPLKDKAAAIVKEKQPFERLHCSLKELEEMFSYSKYKMHYIKNLLPPEGSTVYRCGTLVDLCLGPHIQNTQKIKAFEIMKVRYFHQTTMWASVLTRAELIVLLSGRQGR
jgi:threonyl-tRNA synthetase